METGLLLTVLAALALVWTAGEALDSGFTGPVPVTFRPGREVIGLGAGGLGVALYLVLTDGGPALGVVAAALGAGGILGYWIAWRGGCLDDFGVAVIWSSPWHVAAWAAGAIAAFLGSVWVESLTAIGIGVMVGAVGLGAGRYVFGLQSARLAGRLVEAEMADLHRTCAACGSLVRAWDRFCMSCGAGRPRYCAACGGRLDEAARFCMHCGAPDRGPAPDPVEGLLTQRFCYVCSTPMRLSEAACSQCGSAQPEPCGLCGAPAQAGEHYCGFCGIDLDVAAVARAQGVFEEAAPALSE